MNKPPERLDPNKSDGMGCDCSAYCESDCACQVDWRDSYEHNKLMDKWEEWIDDCELEQSVEKILGFENLGQDGISEISKKEVCSAIRKLLKTGESI